MMNPSKANVSDAADRAVGEARPVIGQTRLGASFVCASPKRTWPGALDFGWRRDLKKLATNVPSRWRRHARRQMML